MAVVMSHASKNRNFLACFIHRGKYFTLFQGFQTSKKNREKEFEDAVTSYQDLLEKDRGKYIRQDSVEDKCDSLKKKWDTLDIAIPERVDSLKEELQNWSNFYRELDEFVAWLNEMESFTKIDKPRDEKEAKQQLKDLEVKERNICYTEVCLSGTIF